MSGVPGIATVLTNAVAFPVAFKAWMYGHALVPIYYLLSMFLSTAYHQCDTWSQCLFHYQFLHDADFYFAYMLISIQAIYLIPWIPERYPDPEHPFAHALNMPRLQSALIAYFSVQNGILIAVTDSQLWVQFAIFLSSFGVLAVFLASYRVKYGEFPAYDMDALLSATCLIGVSVLLFSYQNHRPQYYSYIHAAWHITGYGGGWYYLSVMPMYDPAANLGDAMPQRRINSIIPAVTQVIARRVGRLRMGRG